MKDALEQEAQSLGRVVLVLDTATGSDAEKIYLKFGWQVIGAIPNFARFPDGRLCATSFLHKQIEPLS